MDWGVFHFRGGVAGIWGFGGVRAVVSHLSLGGPRRSSGYHPDVSPFASADLDSILSAIRAEIPTLRGMGVMRIGVFGSRARGAGRLDSDVDVLVEFEPHRDLLDLVAVKQHLESVLGLPVDVTTPSGLRDCDRPAILQDLRYAA